MKNAKELLSEIKHVRAVNIGATAKFRVEAILINGSVLVLKKSATRKPSMVQLYDDIVNGNNRGTEGKYFTFSKSISRNYRNHLKSYAVK